MESETSLYQFDEEFRDTIATVDQKGRRLWVYPKKPSGRYHRMRVIVSIILLMLLFAGPFIRYQGRPFILLNFLERKFILFGQVFWPQDFFLLALTLITFFVFVILFTVSYGRLWCGWMCPQTLFMEMVFRKIEYWIEGNANAQRKLDQSSWNAAKVFKKASKHLIFFAIALLIAHLVMAYIFGIEEVSSIVRHPPAENLGIFIGLSAFTCIFYIVFSYFREQVCIVVCPYGRLQGSLLSKDSILVIYDRLRGEPRGRHKKSQSNAEHDQGDCVDCKLCMHVCPTGIDIRNGTQLECVNCTACMDACDEVMEKVGTSKGLIRYSSDRAMSTGSRKIFTSRMAGYTAVLTILITLLSYFIFTRSDIEVGIFKMPGALYSRSDDGVISNVYTIDFFNKTFDDIPVEVQVEHPKTASVLTVGGKTIDVPRESGVKKVLIIAVPETAIDKAHVNITLGVYEQGKKIETVKARFIGPITSSNYSP